MASPGPDPTRRPVGALVREPAVLCEPDEPVRAVAERMTRAGSTCALVRLDDGRLGIVTDRDLRVRVVGGEVPLDAPVAQAMSAPVFEVGASDAATDVMVELLERGIRHAPVRAARGEVLGVITDADLLASDARTPFAVRRRIARAGDEEALVAAAGELRPAAVALYDARVAPAQLAAVIAAFANALTRRALELRTAAAPELPPFRWLAAGSLGRQEAFPSSDVDSVLVFDGPEGAGERLRALAGDVLGVLERCRFARDRNTVAADAPLFARAVADWRAAVARWLDRPGDGRLLIVISVLADLQPVFAYGNPGDPFGALREGRRHPEFMAQLRRLALHYRPPTGVLRDFVLETSGAHRGELDLKRGGFLPIVDLARSLALATGTTATGTVPRLRAAAEAGALEAGDATTLEAAFDLLCRVRMDHQIAQLRRDEEPTDFLDPATLNPLERRYLREALRAVAHVRRRLARR